MAQVGFLLIQGALHILQGGQDGLAVGGELLSGGDASPFHLAAPGAVVQQSGEQVGPDLPIPGGVPHQIGKGIGCQAGGAGQVDGRIEDLSGLLEAHLRGLQAGFRGADVRAAAQHFRRGVRRQADGRQGQGRDGRHAEILGRPAGQGGQTVFLQAALALGVLDLRAQALHFHFLIVDLDAGDHPGIVAGENLPLLAQSVVQGLRLQLQPRIQHPQAVIGFRHFRS